jgi:hypothetical protein
MRAGGIGSLDGEQVRAIVLSLALLALSVSNGAAEPAVLQPTGADYLRRCPSHLTSDDGAVTFINMGLLA